MKTFNTKLIVSLFITLIMTGCMPDSMTKFKKDEPKKSSSGNEVKVPVVDDQGNTVDTSQFIDPTVFRYRFDGATTNVPDEIILGIGSPLNMIALIDGSVGTQRDMPVLALGCKTVPALPPGLTINTVPSTDTCRIFGSPLDISTDPIAVGEPISYTVTLSYIKKSGTVGTLTTEIKLGVYAAIQDVSYKQNDKILFNVSVNSGNMTTVTTSTDPDLTYVRTGMIASQGGTIGIIKFVDTTNNKIGVKKLVPLRVTNFASLGLPAGVEYVGLSTPRFISANGGKSAKVIRAVAATNTIYVEMLSDASFVVGDTLDDTKTFVSPTGSAVSVTDIDYSFNKIGSVLNLDNNIQYYSEKFTSTMLTRSYEVGKVFGTDQPKLVVEGTHLFLPPKNGVKFSVSPQLPDGLDINEDTGEIVGSFTDAVDPTIFQIILRNKLSTLAVPMSLSSIKKPKDLSFTTRQLVAVKNTVNFNVGETLLKPITPPISRGIDGKILRKYERAGTDDNRYKLSIDAQSGKFTPGSSLDSGNFFYSEKSFIPTLAVAPKKGATPAEVAANELIPSILNYNLAITVASSAGFEIEGRVSTPQGATGRIAGIVGNVLFIQTTILTNPPVHIPFQEILTGSTANTLGNSEVYASSTSTSNIVQIEANNVELSLAMTIVNDPAVVDVPDFVPGSEVTSTGFVAGYVYGASGSNISVSDINMNINTPMVVADTFRYGQRITDRDNVDPGSVDYGTITNVKSKENVFILEVGKYSEIQSNLSEGNGIAFDISAALPQGMTFDKKTGLISGVPTFRTTMKPYEITVSNLVGSAYYLLNIEVRDYFKLSDSSGMATATLHRYGSFKNSRECKVNATDILDSQGQLDVRCVMDVEEKELHTTKLKFLTSTGPGICEFVRVEPYSFYKFSTKPTVAATKVFNIAPSCNGWQANPDLVGVTMRATPPLPEDVCDANYTKRGGLNCDMGAYTVVTYTGGDLSSPSDGNCSQSGEVISTSTIIQCGGRPTDCLEGPVTDILSRNELAAGFTGNIITAHEGVKYNTQLNAPNNKGYKNTMGVANSSAANKCLMTNNDTDMWEAYTATLSSEDSPWGGGSAPFYTFTCLDGASDIKARIRLVVRDWNKAFKINAYLDADLPGLTANGAAFMNNEVPEFGKSNNDYYDWDDNYAGTSSVNLSVNAYLTCPTTVPITGRDYRFPGAKL